MQNNLIEYYNKNGLLLLRIFCFEIRAKDISKHKFTGDSGKVKKIGNWIYTLDFHKKLAFYFDITGVFRQFCMRIKPL